VPDLGRAFLSQNDRDDVESVGAIFYLVGSQKMPGRTDHPGPLGAGDGRFGRAEVLVGPGLDLDKDQRAVAIDHDQVELAHLAEVISRERLETFAFEESLALFLAPAAEPCFVRQKGAFVCPGNPLQKLSGMANRRQI